jgi:protein TonB
LRVQLSRAPVIVQRLIEFTLPPAAPPKFSPPKPERHLRAAPKAAPERHGGSPGPRPAHASPSVAAIVPVKPTAAPSGGGTGIGPAAGSGAGGGTGGQGYGDDGGTDLEKIAGDILPSDYPRSLGNAGVGGRVGVTFTVETNGRVTHCRVTRSSGVAELDALTCRLMELRFRFRPSTDRNGRPIAEEVDWDQDWVAPRR